MVIVAVPEHQYQAVEEAIGSVEDLGQAVFAPTKETRH